MSNQIILPQKSLLKEKNSSLGVHTTSSENKKSKNIKIWDQSLRLLIVWINVIKEFILS